MFRFRAMLLVSLVFVVACGDDDSSSNNTSNNTNNTNNASNNTNNASNNTNNASNNTNNASNNTNNASNNTNNAVAIEIAGTWSNNFDTVETISDTEWDNGFTLATIELYDNGDNFAVLLNPETDEFNPNKYSLIEWTEPADNVFHYCTVDFGLDTLEDALNSTEMADPSDLEGTGCGGFPWTQMTRQ